MISRSVLIRVFVGLSALFWGAFPLRAQTLGAVPTLGLAAPKTAAAPSEPPLRVIVEVPNDPAGRDFIQQKLLPNATVIKQAPPPDPVVASDVNDGMSSTVTSQLNMVRSRTSRLLATAPDVPDDVLAAVRAFGAANTAVDLLWLVGTSILFVVAGLLTRYVAFASGRNVLQRIFDSPTVTVGDRLRLHWLRTWAGLYILGAFLFGSVGAFMLLPTPPLFREIVIVVLALAVVNRLAATFGRVVIAPGARFPEYRILPLDKPLAWFWFLWVEGLVTYAAFSWAVLSLLRIIGVHYESRAVIQAVLLGIGGLAAIVLIWMRQSRPEKRPSRMGALFLTGAIIVGWVLSVTRVEGPFWTLLVIIALPMLMGVVRDGIRNVTQIDKDPAVAADATVVAWAVLVERAFRAVFLFIGASIVARAWNIELGDIAMGATPLLFAVRAAFRILLVILAADVLWRLGCALIDGELARHGFTAPGEGELVRHRQRVATLLPILRNLLFVVIGGIALLMILDSMGIQIGPLLAGAGVIGIAIGFGAQTLVKDIISGIFYLLDDAFRVGEYIQTAHYRGTIESFSLRSVKLRHHRGALTTVPFGDLGAVQNLSRDWVIDKFTVGVTYDTDLDRLKMIMKGVGRELLADPDLAPQIIETLKMQGVEQMGDFAIQIRMKMKTKPGEQFIIRRRAYGLIKKAFEANGIRFAVPTVHVAGGAAQGAAAAAVQHVFSPPALDDDATRAA